mmetsp:Transcript_60082/g.161105  ORF Transcript_60082/g.161105 Transcript_60082/m.161105 type:complete len:412 (-) Transcript_60082:1271-2506(-)
MLHSVQQRMRKQSQYCPGLVVLQNGEMDVHHVMDRRRTLRIGLINHLRLLLTAGSVGVPKVLAHRGLCIFVGLKKSTNHGKPSARVAVCRRWLPCRSLRPPVAVNPLLNVVEVAQLVVQIVHPNIDRLQQRVGPSASGSQQPLVHLVPIFGTNGVEEHLSEDLDVLSGVLFGAALALQVHVGEGLAHGGDHRVVYLADLLLSVFLGHVNVKQLGACCLQELVGVHVEPFLHTVAQRLEHWYHHLLGIHVGAGPILGVFSHVVHEIVAQVHEPTLGENEQHFSPGADVTQAERSNQWSAGDCVHQQRQTGHSADVEKHEHRVLVLEVALMAGYHSHTQRQPNGPSKSSPGHHHTILQRHWSPQQIHEWFEHEDHHQPDNAASGPQSDAPDPITKSGDCVRYLGNLGPSHKKK